MPERPTAVWFEVESFLRYFDHYTSPTGIERVCFEIFGAAHQFSVKDGQVNFCRLSMFTGRFERVSFEQIREAYTSRRGADAPWSILPLSRSPWREWRAILFAASRFPRYAYRVVAQFLTDIAKARSPGSEEELRPGDVIVSVGGSWVALRFAGYIAALKHNRQVRFVQLIHDIIPVLYPDWNPAFGATFHRWLKGVIEVSDGLLTISRCSRVDLEVFARAQGFTLRPVRTIRYGTGFPAGSGLATPNSSGVSIRTSQSLPQRFVLCVSTIDKRKNQSLLLTVWRNLIAAHGPEQVPHLVLVGRAGYFLCDNQTLRPKLLHQSLHRRIVLIGHLSDEDLAEVYRRCLFTVFPSLYEGWGLPVEESLVHGKFCVASRSSSMPEVGGDWVDYFDPQDAADAQRILERALFEPGYAQSREQRIQAQYRAASWRECMCQIVHHAREFTQATSLR